MRTAFFLSGEKVISAQSIPFLHSTGFVCNNIKVIEWDKDSLPTAEDLNEAK